MASRAASEIDPKLAGKRRIVMYIGVGLMLIGAFQLYRGCAASAAHDEASARASAAFGSDSEEWSRQSGAAFDSFGSSGIAYVSAFALLAVGGMLLLFANLGGLLRFQAAQAMPVVEDVAPSAGRAARHVAKGIASGLADARGGSSGEAEPAAHSCGTVNDVNAKFCNGCGETLERRCASCGAFADPEAKFCDGCGDALG